MGRHGDFAELDLAIGNFVGFQGLEVGLLGEGYGVPCSWWRQLDGGYFHIHSGSSLFAVGREIEKQYKMKSKMLNSTSLYQSLVSQFRKQGFVKPSDWTNTRELGLSEVHAANNTSNEPGKKNGLGWRFGPVYVWVKLMGHNFGSN